MSTAELGHDAGARRIAVAPTGMPDVPAPEAFPADTDAFASPATAALIASLGSAMLSTPPGGAASAPLPTGTLPTGVESVEAPAAIVATPALLKTTPAAVPLPGEAELRSILGPQLAGTTVARPNANANANTGGATGSGVPYFLQDATGRAASTVPPAATPETAAAATRGTSVAPVPLPWEAELRSLLAPVLAVTTPALPGLPAAPGTAMTPAGAHPPFDVNAIRRDFPILQEQVNGRPLIWLDNGATTQKPQFVIDRLVHFYQHENSNIHRAAHTLAARATDAYEEARAKVRRFVNASSVEEIVFTRGTTEAINLVAQTWGRQNITADDEILITWLEHHANIVPWQMLCQETGAKLKVVPVDNRGQVLLDQYERLLGPRTRLVAFTQVSNALGTVTPAARMIEMAKRYDAKVLVDGAQSVSHLRTDVQRLNCDFFVFSGHKIFAPTGIGVLHGKREVLEGMRPWQGGGNMIRDVTFDKTEYQEPPQRFEAGTGNIADAVGLGAALDYVERIGLENIAAYEHSLLTYATQRLKTVPGLTLIGTAAEKAAVLSFVLDGFRSEDVGTALNQEGIAVRAGHHCAQPILRRFGLESTVRPSLAFYNTSADIDALTAALQRIASRSPVLD